jgi:AcrR family transcriptional regulator
VQQLTISDLEKASGVSRGTIYFYVRDGLLPVARKLAPTRAVYSEVHLKLLDEITRLKAEGHSLSDIRSHVASGVSAANETAEDLSAERAAHTRRAILMTAARLFAAKGYDATRVDDIVQEVGISTPVFYRYFPSKQDVFVEVFDAFVGWMRRLLGTTRAEEPDPLVRILTRASSFYLGMRSVSRDVIALIKSEATREDSEMAEGAREALRELFRATAEDLACQRLEKKSGIPPADELLAFAIGGAADGITMRASWDDQYSPEDVLRTVAVLLVGIELVYAGQSDPLERIPRHEDVIKRLIKTPISLPTDELLREAL